MFRGFLHGFISGIGIVKVASPVSVPLVNAGAALVCLSANVPVKAVFVVVQDDVYVSAMGPTELTGRRERQELLESQEQSATGVTGAIGELKVQKQMATGVTGAIGFWSHRSNWLLES
ncbi:hypothetical protein FHS16_003320 [Paenibacillus endophyticus]|uniref:Uncharacterized protein n=1 Tax=Paenibacillus endophyticus TaxID=1294268 RepID=A0A7W5C8U8_9BACL|nr:hypothetical protein [Paenibacillus endophyticus]MBB3153258.1 hypothetical protein [Paenibacillus endophyticus]